MSDDNLCGDIRALVTVLREIRDEQRRVADALGLVAQGISPFGKPDVQALLAHIARQVERLADK